ncbi:hypothetical protein PoB_001383000 [Plakobranchus ocellatus]|uniref:Uncharacterized protein n=1 Tax=Plakobranchus ocellatus TaxID=259542 RepID=A0AAV3YY11_9GAST|nr:hypothetical protein PoB_001383000 [Plakobranchus ocellatus]
MDHFVVVILDSGDGGVGCGDDDDDDDDDDVSESRLARRLPGQDLNRLGYPKVRTGIHSATAASREDNLLITRSWHPERNSPDQYKRSR